MKTVIINFGILISVVLSLWYSRAHPRILIYAFILVILARILLVQLLLVARRKISSKKVQELVQQIILTPPPGPPPMGAYYAESGKEIGFGGHLLVLTGLVFFTFMLSHVNVDRKLDFEFPIFLYEMK